MYLLDTNIVSELRKAKAGKADKNVMAWADSVSAASLFLSAITILELETGILLVERRDPTQGAALRTWLYGHVLPALLVAFWRSMPPLLNAVRGYMCLTRGRIGTR